MVKMSLKRVDLSLDPKEEAILLLGKLTELQLQEISTGFKLTVKAGKTGSKKALYNGIVRFLASEEVEEVLGARGLDGGRCRAEEDEAAACVGGAPCRCRRWNIRLGWRRNW